MSSLISVESNVARGSPDLDRVRYVSDPLAVHDSVLENLRGAVQASQVFYCFGVSQYIY